MSTLWKRANGPQMRMLKIVSGAVLDAANAHPHKSPDKIFARSVSKRAVGTISAQWPELLAADNGVDLSSGKRRDRTSARRSRSVNCKRDDKGAADPCRAAPVSKVCSRLGRMIYPLRLAGDQESANAVLSAIKVLAPLVRRERGKPAFAVKVKVE